MGADEQGPDVHAPPGDRTTADVVAAARSAPVTWLRRLGVVAVLCTLLAGASGLLGVRTVAVDARGGGYDLTVTYPRTARAGLDAPFEVDLHSEDGFGDQLVLAMTSSYFGFWEQQGWSPEPAGETSDGEWDYMTFDPPPGQDFTLSFDGYVQPASQRGGDGRVAVVVDGRRVVTASFSTWLAP